MLVIWDIHITSKVQQQMIESLRQRVDRHPDERHIVLVGDIVYHFSYDRTAVMALYELLVERYQQGKTVYVIAGNHDRLGSHFVFAEAKTAFDLLNPYTEHKLYFITTPEHHVIEGREVLFLPYMLDTTMSDMTDLDSFPTIRQHIELLSTSTHSGELRSAALNSILAHQLARGRGDVLVIHHYYMADQIFPGMKSHFSYKDVALCPEWLHVPWVRLLSGHLHQPFVSHNYLCVGSRWHTSSLETQHYKIAARVDLSTWTVSLDYIHINPYIIIQQSSNRVSDVPSLWEDSINNNADTPLAGLVVSQDGLLEVLEQIDRGMQELLASDTSWSIDFHNRVLPPLDLVTLTIQTPTGSSYQEMDEMIDPSVRELLRDVKLKKTADIQLEQLNLTNPGISLVWRHDVLKTYIRAKYPETYERYEEMLRDLKVI